MEDIIIKNIDATTVFIDAERGILRSLAEHFSFYPDNYQWSRAFKNKTWDGKIRLFNVNTCQLPAGLVSELMDFARLQKLSVYYEPEIKRLKPKDVKKDVTKFLESISLPEGIEVREYQKLAIMEHVLKARSLIISPTGSGKSLITYLILRYYHSRGLIKNGILIVPTINLVEQLFNDFQFYASIEYDFDVRSLFHKLHSGSGKETSKPFLISTWQSLQYIEDSKYFLRFDMVICDEVHTAEADVLPIIIGKCLNAHMRVGLTGTLKDTKIKPLQLSGLFGNIIKTKTTRELIDMGYLPDVPIMSLICNYSDEQKEDFWKCLDSIDKDGAAKYAEEMRWIRSNRNRNNLILNFLKQNKKKNNLVLFRSVEHAALFEKVLISQGFKHVIWMKQEMGADEREAVRKFIEENEGVVVLSTYQIFQLGISINNLDNVVSAAPSKGRIRVLQSFGRILRKSKDGSIGYFVDIIDDIRYKNKANTTYNHGIVRLGYYSEEKLKIKYVKVEL